MSLSNNGIGPGDLQPAGHLIAVFELWLSVLSLVLLNALVNPLAKKVINASAQRFDHKRRAFGGG